MFIVLTIDQAAKARGITAPGAALNPIPLEDGVSFILPLAVLGDAAHEVKLAYLAKSEQIDMKDSLIQRDVTPSEFKVFVEDQEKKR